MAAVLFVIIERMQHCKEESGGSLFLGQRTMGNERNVSRRTVSRVIQWLRTGPSTVGYRQSAVYHKRHSTPRLLRFHVVEPS